MKRVVFVRNRKQLASLKEKDNLKIVSLPHYNNPEIKSGEKYLSEKNKRKIKEETRNIVEGLYQDSEYDWTFHGIRIWNIMQHDMYLFIEDIIRYITIIERVVEEEDPEKILVFGKKNLISEIVRDLAGKRGKKVIRIKEPLFEKAYNFYLRNMRQKLIDMFEHFRWVQRKVHQKQVNKENRKEVLFLVAPSLSISKAFTPTIKSLYETDLHPRVVCVNHFSNNNLHRDFKNKGIEHEPIEKYLTLRIERRARKEYKRLMRIKRTEKFRKSLKFEGLKLWNYLDNFHRWYFTINSHLLWSLRYILIGEKILKDNNPELIITSEERQVHSRSVILAGKKKDIPSIMAAHSTNLQKCKWPTEYVSDKLLLFGEQDKEKFIESGINKERIEVTGNPCYELLKKDYDREEICSRLELDTDKRYVFLASQPIPEMEYLMKKVVEIIKNIPDVVLINKQHPIEKGNFQKKISKHNPQKVKVFQDYLFELMHISEFIINVNSNVTIDGFFLDKRTLSLNFWPEKYTNQFARDGIVYAVSDEKELRKQIDRLLEKNFDSKIENKRKDYFKQFYDEDNKPSKKIVNVIKEMTKQ